MPYPSDEVEMSRETIMAMLARHIETGSWDPKDYIDIDPNAAHLLDLLRDLERAKAERN